MNKSTHPTQKPSWPKYGIIIATIVIITAMISCTIGGSSDVNYDATRIALEAQMTIMAGQSGQNAQLTAAAEQAGQVAQDSQATLMAQQATQLAEQATQMANQAGQPAQTEPPPQVTEPPAPATEEPPSQPSISDEQIKSAKILLFEDLAGQKIGQIYPLRYVKDALDMGGYTYKDDGSAQGWFKDDLLSTTKWDLIIVSSEARTRIQGEFFTYLLDHINRGTAVIIEMWYLDEVVHGKVAPIMSKCGIEIYDDWENPDTLSLWPLVPDDPIFSNPNSDISMRKTARFWDWEHGDLLKVTGSTDATLLLGTIATNKMDHGTLVRCMDGRLLIQTFCTHDFAYDEVVPLWENYIYNTLVAKFSTAP
jgi:hypothetical protein